jgi:hypothetical protein
VTEYSGPDSENERPLIDAGSEMELKMLLDE